MWWNLDEELQTQQWRFCMLNDESMKDCITVCTAFKKKKKKNGLTCLINIHLLNCTQYVIPAQCLVWFAHPVFLTQNFPRDPAWRKQNSVSVKFGIRWPVQFFFYPISETTCLSFLSYKNEWALCLCNMQQASPCVQNAWNQWLRIITARSEEKGFLNCPLYWTHLWCKFMLSVLQMWLITKYLAEAFERRRINVPLEISYILPKIWLGTPTV